MSQSIVEAVGRLGKGPLSEGGIQEHLTPLFSRVLNASGSRNEVYLANHSLGRPLDQTFIDVERGLGLWADKLDEAWSEGGWGTQMNHYRAGIAQLIGAHRADCIVPKTSAGQGLRAVLNALIDWKARRPLNIIATRGEFDSIDFILKVYAEKELANIRWIEAAVKSTNVSLFDPVDILSSITDETNLVVISKVMFSSGQVLDGIEDICAKAAQCGARVLLDVYHAAGVIELDLEGSGVDFMIGGCYKYLRGGPGACWLALNSKHLDGELLSLDTGWFAKRDPFSYDRPDYPERATGGDAWLESTPPVVTYYQAEAGLTLTNAIGVDRLRQYNLEQLAYLRAALDEQKVPHYCPSDPRKFGAFTLLPHPAAIDVCKEVRSKGLVADARKDGIRLCPDLLTNKSDLEYAAGILGSL